jgi:hypothetical protein
MAMYVHILNQRRRRLNRRVFRDRLNPLDYMGDEELLRKYRLGRPLILELCNELQNSLERPTRRCHALPVSMQVTLALRFYATGSFQSVLCDSHGVCEMSVSRSVHSVSSHLATMINQHVIFPMTETAEVHKTAFV